MDLLQAMQVFRRVVELRGFSAAARDRGLSNAAVSKQVAALEERLRTRLLNRTTRSVSLTSAGAAYYERCVRILDELEETEQSLSGAAAEATGTLRVNAPTGFGVMHLSPLLPDFLRRFPGLDVEISFTDRFVDVVEEGVDVVIRITSALPDSATLTAQRLARARHVVCASPGYLRKHGAPKTLDDLAGHDCIVYTQARPRGEWQFVGPDGPRAVHVSGRLVVNNSLVVREALLGGLGLALLPSFYVEPELRSGKLRAVLTSYEPRALFVHAVHQRSRYLSPKVRALVDYLRERFAEAEWAVR
ncbi:LysR family transcriptional regulator [Sorangium sp. So ce1099]|uniref:LysR family transcriptional regulator n=1 Tax=Sorangium sp. So ce1099 TaxID=3133331 RepID=UPI003F5F2BB4